MWRLIRVQQHKGEFQGDRERSINLLALLLVFALVVLVGFARA